MQVLVSFGMQATNYAMAQHALPEHFVADFHCDEQTVEDILETPYWPCNFFFSLCHHVAGVGPHTGIDRVFGQGKSSLSHLPLSLYPTAPLHTHQFGTDFYRERSFPGSALHPVLGFLHFSLTCSVVNMLLLLSCIFWHSSSFSSYSMFLCLPIRVGKHDFHFYSLL